jgi:hypothetical protein
MTARPLDAFELLYTSKLCIRPGCGLRFTPYRRHHVYCSNDCRVRLRSTTPSKYEHVLTDRLCIECGSTFLPRQNSQTCCNRDCRKAHKRVQTHDAHLDSDIWQQLHDEAKRLDRSISWVARQCVKRVLGKVDLESGQ